MLAQGTAWLLGRRLHMPDCAREGSLDKCGACKEDRASPAIPPSHLCSVIKKSGICSQLWSNQIKLLGGK